jgi:uncharacterized protein
MARPHPAFSFPEIARGMDQTHHVAEGYRADILLRWGDPLWADSPAFDPLNQSAEAQRRQFGYNCDYVGFVPLDPDTDGAPRGLLCVNHEYTSTHLMFPGIREDDPAGITREIALTEIAAHGGTSSKSASRPAAGARSSARPSTAASPPTRRCSSPAPPPATRACKPPKTHGHRVLGTMNNCAGGITPWGTWLMAEENINGNFMGDAAEGSSGGGQSQAHGRARRLVWLGQIR